MREKPVQSPAQIIQVFLTFLRFQKSMLGTRPLAGKQVVTFPALGGQLFMFKPAECLLKRRCNHFNQ